MNLNGANAIALRILPGIRKEQVLVVGNAALTAAMMSVTNPCAPEESDTRARS